MHRLRRSTKPAPAPSAQVVARWRERRAALTHEVLHDQESDWAWLWQTRIKVLDYLIDRYADQQNTPSKTTERATAGTSQRTMAADQHAATGESTAPYDSAPPPSASFDAGLADRKHRLASLRETNDRRRESQPPIRPAPPPKPLLSPLVERRRFAPRRSPTPEPVDLDAAEDALRRMLHESSGMVRRTTYPGDLPPEARERALQQLADGLELADNERDGVGMLRRIVAIDLGMAEHADDMLDE